MANDYTLKQVKSKIDKARKELEQTGKERLNVGLGSGLVIQVFKGTSKYLARVKINGKYTTKTIGAFNEMTLTEAYKKASALNTDLAVQELEKAKTPLFKDFWKKYREETDTDKKLSIATIRSKNAFYNQILHIFDNVKIDCIDPELVKTYTKNINTSHNNLVNAIKELRACLTYAVNSCIIEYNKISDITKLAKFKFDMSERKGYNFVTADKLRKCLFEPLTYSPIELQTFVLLVCMTSSRMGEILHLKWSNIDFTPTESAPYGVITIKNKDTKTKRDLTHQDHVIAITKQMFNVLKHWKEYKADFESEYLFSARRNPHKPLPKNSLPLPKGVTDNVHLHGLRKTVSTFLNSQKMKYNFSIDEIEYILSHKRDTSIRSIYNKHNNIEENYYLLSKWCDYLESEQLTEPFLELIK